MITGPGSESGHSAGPAAGQSGHGSGGRGRGQHRAPVRYNITDNDNHYYNHYPLMLRFGMCHASRVHGVILINTRASAGGSPAKHEARNK